jgi:putative tryptophan/tyrosine transport system substrate-binding protein
MEFRIIPRPTPVHSREFRTVRIDGQSVQPRSPAAAHAPARIHARFLDVRDSGDIENSFQAIRQSPPDAIQVIADPFLGGHLEAIVAFARETRLPAMYPFRHGVEAGGLISYAADYRDLFRRAAGYIDRIIKGTPLVALPVEYPAKFELLLNISTAKALGLTIPSSLLARADEVIE